jgi:hypothetical protein
MRDIRDDLRDRANLLDGQINDAQGQFEALVQRFKQEHDSRLKDLKAELQALSTLIGAEERRLDRETAASKTQSPIQHPQPKLQDAQPMQQPQVQSAQQSPPQKPQQRFADFLIRKLSEVGAMSKDDLRHLAEQGGYFAEAESARRGVHIALTQALKAGLVRELPNGSFAPPTLPDTMRLRRAI